MTTQTHMSAGQAKALLKIAPKKNGNRPYLNSVCLDPAGYAVTTDGHMMLALRIEPFNAPAPVIVPRYVLERAVKLTGKNGWLVIELSDTGGRITTGSSDSIIGFSPMDATYPDWRRVVPRTVSGEVAQFQAVLLNSLHDAVCLALNIKNIYPRLAHNGNNAAIAYASPDILAILMPCRGDAATAKDVSLFLNEPVPSMNQAA